MPAIKAISGHTGCGPVQRYLEKGDRALGRDLLNFDEVPDADPALAFNVPEGFRWADAMDALRAEAGNNAAWKGREARTFKHFVISPDPADGIGLEALRELTLSWARRHFGEFQVAVVYHDDNEGCIPHAHVIVNNTNVVTWRRLHTDDPLALNRSLQSMVAERGLSAMSDERRAPGTGFERLTSERERDTGRARTLQETYRSRAERRAVAEGGYSWVTDIRGRVSVARGLARSMGELEQILEILDVRMEANSSHARRPDWIFSLADEPTKRVSGERLGASYGKSAVERKITRAASGDHIDDVSARELLRRARNAVELGDLGELDCLSDAIAVCNRWHIGSIEAATTAIAAQRGRLERADTASQRKRIAADIAKLESAREFLRDRSVLPLKEPGGWASGPSSMSAGAQERARQLDRERGRQR